MLTANLKEHDRPGLFGQEFHYDIFDDGTQVGGITHNRRTWRAAFTFVGQAYTLDLMVNHQAKRFCWPLKDASGQVLAVAEPAVRTNILIDLGFVVTRGGQRYAFREPFHSFVSAMPYHLYRPGSDVSLGSVGQQSIFAHTLNANLPVDFDPQFQIFLLALVVQKIHTEQLVNGY